MKRSAEFTAHKIRLLQKVVRDCCERGGSRTYRYDLLADCADEKPEYVIRAHVAEVGEQGKQYEETASVAKPIYGAGASVREVFLDVAYADKPVDPVHLADVMQDRCSAADIDHSEMETEDSLDEYYRYEQAWRRGPR